MQSHSRHALPLFLVLTKCDLSVRALISCISCPTYVTPFDIREGAITVIVAEAKCLVRRRRPPPWERWKPNELDNDWVETNLNTCRWWRGSTPSTCTRGCMVSASSTRLLGLWRFVHRKSWSASYVLSHKSGDQEVCREADGHQGRENRHQAQQGHLGPGRQRSPFQNACPSTISTDRAWNHITLLMVFILSFMFIKAHN